MKGLWFTEMQKSDLALSCQVQEVLHVETTPFQELKVLETLPFGRMLTLDDVIQTTLGDEFGYHEMIAHVPLNTHPSPERVLVIGGGDGGTVREVVKHPEVQLVRLVEIDARVSEVSQQWLPELSRELDNPRVELRFEDGIKHVQERTGEYDVIIIDSTDPVGPAAGLFSQEFYQDVFKALKPDGLFVAQTESPYFNQQLIRDIHQKLRIIFPITSLYMSSIPTYPGGTWTFSIGSKQYDPRQPVRNFVPQDNRYYTAELHQAAFILPRFVANLVNG